MSLPVASLLFCRVSPHWLNSCCRRSCLFWPVSNQSIQEWNLLTVSDFELTRFVVSVNNPSTPEVSSMSCLPQILKLPSDVTAARGCDLEWCAVLREADDIHSEDIVLRQLEWSGGAEIGPGARSGSRRGRLLMTFMDIEKMNAMWLWKLSTILIDRLLFVVLQHKKRRLRGSFGFASLSLISPLYHFLWMGDCMRMWQEATKRNSASCLTKADKRRRGRSSSAYMSKLSSLVLASETAQYGDVVRIMTHKRFKYWPGRAKGETEVNVTEQMKRRFAHLSCRFGYAERLSSGIKAVRKCATHSWRTTDYFEEESWMEEQRRQILHGEGKKRSRIELSRTRSWHSSDLRACIQKHDDFTGSMTNNEGNAFPYWRIPINVVNCRAATRNDWEYVTSWRALELIRFIGRLLTLSVIRSKLSSQQSWLRFPSSWFLNKQIWEIVEKMWNRLQKSTRVLKNQCYLRCYADVTQAIQCKTNGVGRSFA